ncbi:MAG: cytochrome d ubiquinol oxidase subunit [Streptosporangiaceae bacterium]|nr:cytochrome d ubiquinol oxidase subunit [Streptosporangiaceae bacterium]
MTYPDIALGLILVGLSAYLVFGGADFGAGFWHLLAFRRRDHERPHGARDLAGVPGEHDVIEQAMGPMWEANHVWLIFVMVMTWTAFPPIFAALMTEYWVPLSLAALGVLVRGSAFVFWKAVPDRGWYALAFGVSSILTPYCMGAVAGAIAAHRASWLSGPAVYAGLLTTALCAYLAAVYLTGDARRVAGPEVVARFRLHALAAGTVVGVLALPGAAVLGVRSPLIGVSAAAGVISLGLLLLRRYLLVRATAAPAVAAVLWGAAELSGLDFRQAAAQDAVLQVAFCALGIGAVVLVPSMAWLFLLFQRAAGPAVVDGRQAEPE